MLRKMSKISMFIVLKTQLLTKRVAAKKMIFLHLVIFLAVLLAMNGSKAKLFMEMKTALYFLYNQILEYYPQELQIAQLIQIFNIYVRIFYIKITNFLIGYGNTHVYKYYINLYL